MSQPNSPENTPLNPPDLTGDQKKLQLEGQRAKADQSAVVDYSEIDSIGTNTATELEQGEPGDSLENEGGDGDSVESLDMLTELELRADETDDVMEAVEEGYTYIPPIDPPTVPTETGDLENAEVASGLGVSSLDEEYTADTHSEFLPSDDEMKARIRDAFRADSTTTAYAHRIGISVRDNVVTLRGTVADLVDSDKLVAVAANVEGIEDVIDELDIDGL